LSDAVCVWSCAAVWDRVNLCRQSTWDGDVGVLWQGQAVSEARTVDAARVLPTACTTVLQHGRQGETIVTTKDVLFSALDS